eukprot:1098933-Rhodomonas_salina.1
MDAIESVKMVTSSVESIGCRRYVMAASSALNELACPPPLKHPRRVWRRSLGIRRPSWHLLACDRLHRRSRPSTRVHHVHAETALRLTPWCPGASACLAPLVFEV